MMDHAGRLSSEPLLAKSVLCSYNELALLIRLINWETPLSNNGPSFFSAELMRRIISFLTVKPVNPKKVTVTLCSSHDGRHDVTECLTESEDTWWMSESHTMPGGQGREFIQFSLAPTLCRLSSVSIKIPPLPVGPLSVAEFQLEQPSSSSSPEPGETTWEPLHPVPFTTSNRTGWQPFILPQAVDVQEVRFVCLSNQMSQFLKENGALRQRAAGIYDSVGFYSIRFE